MSKNRKVKKKCELFINGSCTRGENCSFQHVSAPIISSKKPNWQSNTTCRQSTLLTIKEHSRIFNALPLKSIPPPLPKKKNLDPLLYIPVDVWDIILDYAYVNVERQIELSIKREVAREIVCLSCTRKFTMEPSEVEWFRSAGFFLPKRCRECRWRRRI